MPIHNPYWDAVKEFVCQSERSWGTTELYIDYGSVAGYDKVPQRNEFVHEFCWTIPDPQSVSFLTRQCAGRKILDPLAGTGYWANLLSQMGIDIIAADAAPSDNPWHRGRPLHYPMFTDDAVDSTKMHEDRMLILSWIPYGSTIGEEVLEHYKGNRLITIGEEDYGCCAHENFWKDLRKGWDEIASHRPIQWFGIHDFITVWERKALTA